MKTPKHPQAERRRGFAGLRWEQHPEVWAEHVRTWTPPAPSARDAPPPS